MTDQNMAGLSPEKVKTIKDAHAKSEELMGRMLEIMPQGEPSALDRVVVGYALGGVLARWGAKLEAAGLGDTHRLMMSIVMSTEMHEVILRDRP